MHTEVVENYGKETAQDSDREELQKMARQQTNGSKKQMLHKAVSYADINTNSLQLK